MTQSTTERLAIYMAFKDINNNMITTRAGLSVGQIGKAIANNSGINSTSIEKILHAYPELSPEWLLTGTGEMLKSPVLKSFEKPEREVPELRLIPIDAMAGYGEGGIEVMDFEGETFRVPTFRGADFLISVKGTSMYPKYNSGDIVACKKIPLNDIFFQWNKVYVLDTIQGAIIKRIKKGTDDNHITLVSDNTNYDPFQLHLSAINAVSIVMGVIRIE